jgi:hypothetical protein
MEDQTLTEIESPAAAPPTSSPEADAAVACAARAAQDDARHIVMRAPGFRDPAERCRRCLGVAPTRKNPRDLRVGHHVREPVGAEPQDIPGRRVLHSHVNVDALTRAQRAAQRRMVRHLHRGFARRAHAEVSFRRV